MSETVAMRVFSDDAEILLRRATPAERLDIVIMMLRGLRWSIDNDRDENDQDAEGVLELARLTLDAIVGAIT